MLLAEALEETLSVPLPLPGTLRIAVTVKLPLRVPRLLKELLMLTLSDLLGDELALREGVALAVTELLRLRAGECEAVLHPVDDKEGKGVADSGALGE